MCRWVEVITEGGSKIRKIIFFIFFLLLSSFVSSKLVINASTYSTDVSKRWVETLDAGGNNITDLGNIQEFNITGNFRPNVSQLTYTNPDLMNDNVIGFTGYTICDKNHKCGLVDESSTTLMVSWLGEDGSFYPIGTSSDKALWFWNYVQVAGYTAHYIHFDFLLNKPYYLHNPNIVQNVLDGNDMDIYATYYYLDNVQKTGTDFSFNRVVIVYDATSSGDVRVSSYVIENATIYENLLPFFNVTFEDGICLPVNESGMYVNLEWDVYDNESDTVYYYNRTSTNENFNDWVYFGWNNGFIDIPSWEIKDNLQEVGYCQINERFETNLSKNNIVYYPNLYTLALDSTCTGIKKGYLYRLPYILENLFYSTGFYGLQTTTESINFTLKDEMLKTVVSFKFDVINSTNVTVTNNGVVLYNKVYPTKLEFSLNNYNQAGSKTALLIAGASTYVNLTKESQNIVRYIEVTNANGVVYQDKFYFSGNIVKPVWSTTQPSRMWFNGYGYFYPDFYVSDNLHLLTTTQNYSKKSYELYIPSCQYFMNSTDVSNATISNIFVNTFGNALKSFFIDAGLYEQGKRVLWFVVAFLFIGILISEYAVTRHLSLTFPMILASCFGLFIGYLLTYTVHMLVFGIMLAFSLATPLAMHYLGGDNK